MKIRIGMSQLSDTDNEKIKLGIRKIQNYEQDWLEKATYENIREIEMTPDEWKKLVEKLPYKDPNTNAEVYLINGGKEIYHPYHADTIVRDVGVVVIQGNYVNTVVAKLILETIQDKQYELYREPELTPKPVPQPEPKKAEPTPEQIKETQIRGIEKEIADEGKALSLLSQLDLPEQVKAHGHTLNFLRKKLDVVKVGYEHIHYRDRYETGGLEAYKHPIPLDALEAYKKAKSAQLFDCFRVWIESDDPYLVGKIIGPENEACYKIAEWG